MLILEIVQTLTEAFMVPSRLVYICVCVCFVMFFEVDVLYMDSCIVNMYLFDSLCIRFIIFVIGINLCSYIISIWIMNPSDNRMLMAERRNALKKLLLLYKKLRRKHSGRRPDTDSSLSGEQYLNKILEGNPADC